MKDTTFYVWEFPKKKKMSQLSTVKTPVFFKEDSTLITINVLIFLGILYHCRT